MTRYGHDKEGWWAWRQEAEQTDARERSGEAEERKWERAGGGGTGRGEEGAGQEGWMGGRGGSGPWRWPMAPRQGRGSKIRDGALGMQGSGGVLGEPQAPHQPNPRQRIQG